MDRKEEGKGKKDVVENTSMEASSPSTTADVESVHGDGSESEYGEPVAKSESLPEEADATVGKINNLITSDLNTIAYSYQIVELRRSLNLILYVSLIYLSSATTAIQIVISVVVLYRLLSWR